MYLLIKELLFEVIEDKQVYYHRYIDLELICNLIKQYFVLFISQLVMILLPL
ncbi:hypothetical protein MODO_0614 [Myroides odoratimimus]|nr:hypothetical protein MODO_0614 [Myroides odoratimimus]